MKYWEIIADKLHASGWSWGYCSAVTKYGWRWSVDAHGSRQTLHRFSPAVCAGSYARDFEKQNRAGGKIKEFERLASVGIPRRRRWRQEFGKVERQPEQPQTDSGMIKVLYRLSPDQKTESDRFSYGINVPTWP